MAYPDLDPKRFGLACGIISGVWLLILALVPQGKPFVDIIGSLFSGYVMGGMGAIVGLIYGIIVCGITGYAFAWTHNYLKKKI